MTPCPHCQKPMGKRTLRKLAPRIPPQWPADSARRIALEEAQDGWCAICDVLPVRARKGSHRFTCGRTECKARWRDLCVRDWRERRKVAA